MAESVNESFVFEPIPENCPRLTVRVSFISLLIECVVDCAVEVADDYFIGAFSHFNYCVCFFPEVRSVFGWCVYCQGVDCGHIRENYCEEEGVIVGVIANINYFASTVFPEEY